MIGKLITFAIVSAVIYLAIALGLIASNPPKPLQADAATLDFDVLAERGALPATPAGVVEENTEYTAGDGARLPIRIFRNDADPAQPIILMVHGSGWHGGQFERLGRALADLAEVRIVTLRGHGAAPERRGDIDDQDQLEDDLAAVLKDAAGREVILLGHSSGGGLVVRFAGGAHGHLMDKAILLAPFLQYDAPTTRTNSGGWARPLTRRIVGLSMLNAIGVHALDHLTAIQFNMPVHVLEGPQGHMATTAYSWRLNQGYAPRRDWLADVAKLPEFLLVAGTEDEAFDAVKYEAVMAPANPRGHYRFVAGVGHLDIVDAPQGLAAIRDFLK